MTIDQRADLINQLQRIGDHAPQLEQLYRQALSSNRESVFKEALALRLSESPGNMLLTAWACRLDLPLAQSAAVRGAKTIRHWRTALIASATLALCFAFLADGKPPVPLPGEAAASFWVGWAPLTALAVLVYLALFNRFGKGIRPVAIPIAALGITAFTVALTSARRTDDIAVLVALHLPFLSWATVGASLAWAYTPPLKQGYAFIAKSLETALTGAIYAATGILFLALSFGIFAVLGVKWSPQTHLFIAACGLGSVPILALASAYDPTQTPAEQNWETGLGRLLTIFSRIFLALSLVVLAVYLLFFVPSNFWHPFRAREALIVYNATIMAILVLLIAIATAAHEAQDPILRRSIIALVALTTILNVYALAAIISRIEQFGLSPNRYTAAGWNIVTLAVLAMLLVQLARSQPQQWLSVLRQSITYALVPATAWALWVCLGLPLSFPFAA